MRLLHESDLLRCFRNSSSVTYISTLPSLSSSGLASHPPYKAIAHFRKCAMALRATFSICIACIGQVGKVVVSEYLAKGYSASMRNEFRTATEWIPHASGMNAL